MSDEEQMKTHTDIHPDDRGLIEAIARDRTADPAPPLSEAALARIMAEVPQARTATPQQAVRHHRSWDFRGALSIAGLFPPPAWQALAVAGVAGLIAGGVVPVATMGETTVTPEQEFSIYLQSDDTLATLLQEDL